jgi:hypothetical protein
MRLTAVVAMLLASKYIECYPLQIEAVVSQLGHGDFDAEAVRSRERDILKTLNFNIAFATVYDLLEHHVATFVNSRASNIDTTQWDTIHRMRELCIYLGMMASHEYNLLPFT